MPAFDYNATTGAGRTATGMPPPKDTLGALRQNYRDASRGIRRSIYSTGQNVPVYRMGSAPFYMSTAKARSRTYTGLKEIFGTGSRAGAGGKFAAFEAAMGYTGADDIRRLKKYALRIGRARERGMPTRDLLKEARAITAKAPPSKMRKTFSGTIKSMMTGTRASGPFKAYQHVLNPRNLAVVGAAYALGRGAMWYPSIGERFYTENIGQGRFGMDTAGTLGPAALKGLRFQTIRRRRVI